MAKTIKETDLMNILRDRVKKSTQRQIAREIGVSPQMLNDVLNERRALTDRIAAALGFSREVIYRKVA